eukprot:TRINITY_DN16360_c0_g1_i1.p1 TRINITY_DN16360_c0_g1~~TRINITY_DN16360_c0_g1_i1.p1  ORF type:complete len:133 (+),score=15.97 TRINITY_DN16360_c0_g1_i1:252-650(+)
MRANRAAVLRVLEDHHIRCTTNVNRWEGKGARDPILYRFTLETSQFTLCPWGNNPETMRMYEAMECGSIPILQWWPRPEEDPLTALGPTTRCPSSMSGRTCPRSFSGTRTPRNWTSSRLGSFAGGYTARMPS